MSCIVKYLGRSGEALSLVLKGSVYKFAPLSETTLDSSLGELIERLPDKVLRSKFKVTYSEENARPAPNIEAKAEQTIKPDKRKKAYAPKRTRQESIL